MAAFNSPTKGNDKKISSPTFNHNDIYDEKDHHNHNYPLDFSNCVPPSDLDKYDLCLVFPVTNDGNLTNDGTDLMDKIIHAIGMKYFYQFYTHDRKARMVVIRSSLAKLKSLAETLKYQMLLDPKVIRSVSNDGDRSNNIQPFKIPTNPSLSIFSSFNFIFAPYKDDSSLSKYYWIDVDANQTTPFKKNIRLDLLLQLLASNVDGYNSSIDLHAAKSSGTILDFFPLPEYDTLEILKESIIHENVVPWKLPFRLICDYWGEKVGLLFTMSSYASLTLMLPSIVGIAFEISTLGYSDHSRPEIPVFGYFISLWTIYYYTSWDRQEQLFFMQRGIFSKNTEEEMDEMEEIMEGSDAYDVNSNGNGSGMIGDLMSIIFDTRSSNKRSSRTNEYEQKSHSLVRSISSWLLTLILAAVAVGVTVIVYYIRYKFVDIYLEYQEYTSTSHGGNSTPGVPTFLPTPAPSSPVLSSNVDIQWIISSITAIAVQILSYIFYLILPYVVELENYRNESDFEKSLILKSVVVQFILNFSSFYWLAFGALWVPLRYQQCSTKDECITALVINNIILFGYKQGKIILLEYLLPFVFDIWHHLTCKNIFYFFSGGFLRYWCEEGYYDDQECYYCDHCLDCCLSRGCYPPGCSDGQIRAYCRASDFRNASRIWPNIKAWFRRTFNLDGSDVNENGTTSRINYCCYCCTSATEVCKACIGDDDIPEICIEYRKRTFDESYGYVYCNVELLVDVGYATLFSTLLPAAPAIATISMFCGSKLFAKKLCTQYRRPLPIRTFSCDIWHTIYTIIVSITVTTNAAVVIFTLTTFDMFSLYVKLLLFIAFQWTLLLLLYITNIKHSNEEYPEIRMQKKRRNFIRRRLIDRVPDKVVNPVSVL